MTNTPAPPPDRVLFAAVRYADLQEQVISAMARRTSSVSAQDLLPDWPAEVTELVLRRLAAEQGFILCEGTSCGSYQGWSRLGVLDLRPWDEVRAFLRGCSGLDDYRCRLNYSVDRALNGKRPFTADEFRALPGPDRTVFWLARQTAWGDKFRAEVQEKLMQLAKLVGSMPDFLNSEFAQGLVWDRLSWRNICKMVDSADAASGAEDKKATDANPR